MVVIRLSRGGTKKRPFYRVVVADCRAARDGNYIERLGYFNPIATGGEKRLEVDMERVSYWVGTGAQPSERVASLLNELAKPEIVEKRKLKNTELKAKKAAKVAAQAAESAKLKEEQAEQAAAAAV